MMHNLKFLAAAAALVFACGCASERSGQFVPKVVFTFDDGVAEHYDTVAPILEKYGFRGTFNVIVDSVDRKKGTVTWAQLRDLDRRGHAIENHTLTHPNLAKMAETNNLAGVEREVTLSRDIIASNVGRAPTFVCYPFGAWNAATECAVRDSWQKPMCPCRRNFGEGYAPGDVTRYIEECIEKKQGIIDLMCHGVSANGGGWKPFATPEIFESYVKEVKELADRKLVKVVLYRDCEIY